jgi:hypothetical protein
MLQIRNVFKKVVVRRIETCKQFGACHAFEKSDGLFLQQYQLQV